MLNVTSTSRRHPPLSSRFPSTHARGFTLIELIVALGLGGVAFGAFALVVAQQERTHADLAAHIRARGQLREGLAPLITDLRAVAPGLGDIPPGEARDSSLELRAMVGTAVACAVQDRTVIGTFESFVTRPAPGDTSWFYSDDDTGSVWVPLAIAGMASAVAGSTPDCTTPVPPSGAAATWAAAPHYAFTMSGEIPPAVAPGAPIRVTRRVRYSLYRAPDGRWYLGRREWSAARARFEPVQPVSGPYRAYAPESTGASGLELRYFDRTGARLPSGTPSTARIAKVVVTLRAPPVRGGAPSDRRDAMSITVAVRNRT